MEWSYRNRLRKIAEAIFVANRHAKTALNPEYLYALKQKAIDELLKQGVARKIGLHQSPTNPRKKDVLIQIEDYYFHIPMTPQDCHLPDLGKRDLHYRNPRPDISRGYAIRMLQEITGLRKEDFPESPFLMDSFSLYKKSKKSLISSRHRP